MTALSDCLLGFQNIDHFSNLLSIIFARNVLRLKELSS